jgi:hypothetical protein
VVSGAAQNREEVERYASCTLLAAQIKYLDLSEKNSASDLYYLISDPDPAF